MNGLFDKCFPDLTGVAPAIECSIPIVPVAKQSVRHRVVKPKSGAAPWVQAYQPPDVVVACGVLLVALRQFAPRTPFDCAVAVRVLYRYEWRKSHTEKFRAPGWQWKATKPDGDNLMKPTKDAIEHAGWVTNDSRISDERCVRIWCATNGIDIRLWPLGDVEQPLLFADTEETEQPAAGGDWMHAGGSGR